MNILLSQSSAKSIDNLIAKPPHALGIIAPIGSGKLFVSKYISKQLLGRSTDTQNEQFMTISPNERQTITIDQVRDIQSFLRLKRRTDAKINRIIVIEDAHLMQAESQNALLKTIEEPTPQSMIILTANSSSKLLPTVLSRLEHLYLANPESDDIDKYFSNTYSSEQISKAKSISLCRMGLLTSLLQNNEHPLYVYIQEVKKFLSADKYEQLSQINGIISDNLTIFLEALLIVSYSAFRQATLSHGASSQIKKWHNLHKNTAISLNNLNLNANLKITMTNLVLKI